MFFHKPKIFYMTYQLKEVSEVPLTLFEPSQPKINYHTNKAGIKIAIFKDSQRIAAKIEYRPDKKNHYWLSIYILDDEIFYFYDTETEAIAKVNHLCKAFYNKIFS